MPTDISASEQPRSDSRSDITGVIDSVRAIVKALRDSGRDAEQKLGITSAQLYVLQELRASSASINELASRTYTHQSSVSMVVARLVESKLAARTAARGDARKLSVSITPAGRALLRKSPDAAQMRLTAALKQMSRSDLRSLKSQLHNLLAIMDSQSEEAKAPRRRYVSA